MVDSVTIQPTSSGLPGLGIGDAALSLSFLICYMGS
jgi:hypothetical protein